MFDKLFKIFKSKTPIQKMYSELDKFGGLQNAINIEFEKLNSTLRVSKNSELETIPFTFATVVNGNKFSQIYIGAEEKIYLPDFWKDGVCLAYGQTKNISDLVQVLNFWLSNDITTKQLADKFTFVSPSEKALAFDNNNEVEYTWKSILQDPNRAEIHDFVKLAINDNVLNKLFPFTSLETLCFSRCTGYPYDINNLPTVTPKLFENLVPIHREKIYTKQVLNKIETQFVVANDKNEYLGEGNAEEALEIVKTNLPNNIQPARKGTADD
jgi:hypothetical protein